MEVVTKLEDIKTCTKPIALTIGTYDGLHLGHQKIFHTLKELVDKEKGTVVTISFSNHPANVLKKDLIIPKITSTEEKLTLFKAMGVNLTVSLEFTSKLQNMGYESFLSEIREKLPFDYLVLGEGASFGKNREGNEENLKKLGKKLGFKTYFVEKLILADLPISSKRVREKLEDGDVEFTKKLLGRPYALYAPFNLEKLQETGENRLKIIFDFQNHCIIPSGYYVVNLKSGVHEAIAVAYLTTLGSDAESKTFDLDIYIKGSKAEFMNDRVKIEFVRKITSSKTFEEVIESSDKIKPLNL